MKGRQDDASRGEAEESSDMNVTNSSEGSEEDSSDAISQESSDKSNGGKRPKATKAGAIKGLKPSELMAGRETQVKRINKIGHDVQKDTFINKHI